MDGSATRFDDGRPKNSRPLSHHYFTPDLKKILGAVLLLYLRLGNSRRILTGDLHHTIHQGEVPGECTDVRVSPLLLGSLEPDDCFLLWLNHPRAVKNTGMSLRLPVHLFSLRSQFENRLYQLPSLVFPF